ncbi:MAG: DoxX family protein [Haloplanus sp.]
MSHRPSPRAVGAALGTLALVGASDVAAAHVRYVTDGTEPVDVVAFLVSTLTDPLNLAVLAAGAVAVAGGVLAYLRVRPARADVDAFHRAVSDYADLLPWLLRLAVGLPLVGAGFAGYFFSPLVTLGDPTVVRLFGITLGFLLLFGLATRFVAAVGLLVYLVALAGDPTLMLAFEYVPGFVALVLVGSGRPSADDVVARVADDDRTYYSRIDPVYRAVAVPFRRRVEPYQRYVPVVLRVGVGVAFVYLGVSQKLLAPGPSLAVVEKYHLTAVVPVSPALWVVGAGLTETLVGVAFLVGLFSRAFALVAFCLLTTTLFGLPDDPVLAHVSLFGLASALLVVGSGPASVDAWLRRVADDDAPADRTAST